MASSAGIRMGRAYVELGADDTAFQKALRDAEKRFRDMGSTLQSVGKQMIGGGLAAATPMALSVKSFADFESAMARVRAIKDPTEETFKALSDRAKQLGIDTVFSAKDAATAMANFAQAGFSVESIMTAVGPTLDLAATAQIGIAEAGDIAAKVMNNMGIEADQLVNVVDVMAKAVTTANTDVMMLGDAFKFVGPIAKSVGISLEETTAAIQLLSNAGIQGEMAGTTLRGAIISLGSPSEQAAKMMKQLGITVKDSKGDFLPLVNIIGQFERALAGMGTAEQLEALGKILPDRQAVGIIELISQGSQKLADSTAALGDSAGTAARVAGVQLNTLKGSGELVMSSLEGVGIVIGEALMPSLREMGAVLVGVLNAFGEWVKGNKEVVVTAAAVVASTIALGAALVGIGATLKLVSVAVTALRFGLGALSMVTQAFAGLTAIFTALMSPMGLIIVGLGALAAALIYTGQAGELFGGLAAGFESVKTTVLTAFGAITEAMKSGDLSKASAILWAAVKLEWSKGVLYLKTLWADWGAAIQIAFASVSTRIASGMINLWASIQAGAAIFISGIQDAWAGMVGFFMKTWNGFGAFFMEVWERVKALFTGEDAEAKIRAIRDEAIKANAALDAQRDKDRGGNQAWLDAIERDRRAQQVALNDMFQEKARGIRGGAAQGVAGATAELARAQAEFDRLTAKGPAGVAAITPEDDEMASFAAALSVGDPTAMAAAFASETANKLAPVMGRAPEDMPDLTSALEGVRQQIDTQGTFSAGALRGMGSTVADKQLEEQKKSNDKLDKIEKKLEQPVFT